MPEAGAEVEVGAGISKGLPEAEGEIVGKKQAFPLSICFFRNIMWAAPMAAVMAVFLTQNSVWGNGFFLRKSGVKFLDGICWFSIGGIVFCHHLLCHFIVH